MTALTLLGRQWEWAVPHGRGGYQEDEARIRANIGNEQHWPFRHDVGAHAQDPQDVQEREQFGTGSDRR